ncbi:hypothetical protein QA648_35305 (plasmid) [Rhizobium sp. CB3171]|uniref:hypothetical protein n=1 Tax=Rhizobium sp. CB3171 TaxID=3039157 RepID=UPI0024B21FEB|nr:hypothetical protein [Rhizobium sp. CB3171]WFU07173.1 hypothetical protein QA648_35305 [Rhizobium sp. CB3171]
MNFINVTHEYGLVIRRAALVERGVALDDLLSAMKVRGPLDSDAHLISFGPSFGQEALEGLVKVLSALGLRYFDDFIDIVGDYPRWCQFKVGYAAENDDQKNRTMTV